MELFLIYILSGITLCITILIYLGQQEMAVTLQDIVTQAGINSEKSLSIVTKTRDEVGEIKTLVGKGLAGDQGALEQAYASLKATEANLDTAATAIGDMSTSFQEAVVGDGNPPIETPPTETVPETPTDPNNPA